MSKLKYRIENRSSPCSMGVQYRIVSDKAIGPWREGEKGRSGMTLAWKAYKELRAGKI
jgi:hypothetical protein